MVTFWSINFLFYRSFQHNADLINEDVYNVARFVSKQIINVSSVGVGVAILRSIIILPR